LLHGSIGRGQLYVNGSPRTTVRCDKTAVDVRPPRSATATIPRGRFGRCPSELSPNCRNGILIGGGGGSRTTDGALSTADERLHTATEFGSLPGRRTSIGDVGASRESVVGSAGVEWFMICQLRPTD